MRLLTRKLPIAAVLLALVAVPQSVPAEERHLDVGLRLAIAAADGTPANDIPGAGVLAHYALDSDWTLGAAVDRSEYDFEEPAKHLGIVQDPTLEPIDVLATATTLSFWIERALAPAGESGAFFVGAGLGAAFIDVPDVRGARADGGTFDVQTDANTELVVFGLAGLRRQFGRRWYGELAVRAEQHFADWQVTDRVSGARGTIDDYLSWGAHLAVGWRW
jgi:hypothetical protein